MVKSGVYRISTETGTRVLSQPLVTSQTYQVVRPVTLLDGRGEPDRATPPAGAVYHRRVVPMAVRAVVGAKRQYDVSRAVGGAGLGFTNTCTRALSLMQPKGEVCVT
jgi:hypothetical protein